MRDHPLDGTWTTEALPDPSTEEGNRDALDTLIRALRGESIPRARRRIEVVPISQARAFAFVRHVHRHQPKPPAGWKFGCALQDHLGVVGVIVVGRPSSRHLDDGLALEVTRVAVMDRVAGNAASRLLGAAARAAKGLGYSRLITYTTLTEDGASLKAAGFVKVARTAGGKRSRRGRPRADVDTDPKHRWERIL